MIAWTLVVATFVGVAWLAVLLARQGHPGRLSGGEVLARWRRSRVMDRPAGPDAEAMSVGGPGQPRVAPYAGDGAGDEIGVDGRPELASPTAERSADAERLVDRDVEGLAAQSRPTDVPDDDRVVPEDVNEYVPEDQEPEA